ncbi:MAG: hypothetical protein ACI9TB_001711 [Parasphingorhabdus sp.]|jgi:hypothetical protein|uniref:hypothetical protein n=1 Tax=Parasphingorhabdus sp. TaxID=2709688 RepID=UPI001B6250CC|nr:hypothetical protein [Sphingomonadales bacterium]|tara:strand:- start:2220 stop:2555 length:336 start_codon:yes stop_codon:yes gene_type:complete
MKNIQIVDAAANATFSIFQATESEFKLIFPANQDIEFAEDLFERLGNDTAYNLLMPVWDRPILKREVNGLHGTLFYNWIDRKTNYPASKREVDMDERSINEAQRILFRSNR